MAAKQQRRIVEAWDLDAKTRSLAMAYNAKLSDPKTADPRTHIGTGDIADKGDLTNLDASAWFDAIKGPADDLILDVPGGRLDDLANALDAGPDALVSYAKSQGREVVVVSVIGTKNDAIVPLYDNIQTFGHAVHHVVVKNGLFADENQFIIFDGVTVDGKRVLGDGSDVAKEYGAEVIYIKKLSAIADQLADIHGLTYAEAATNTEKMRDLHAANVKSFLDDVKKRLTGTHLDPNYTKRRLIIMPSNKGGVGKTTIARFIIDVFRANAQNNAAALSNNAEAQAS